MYSLKLKQKLLDNLQLEREEKRVRDMVDTSTGLASRLDKVPHGGREVRGVTGIWCWYGDKKVVRL